MDNICYSGIRFHNSKARVPATLANVIASWGAICRLAGALLAVLALALGVACAVASADDLAFRILAFLVIGGIPAAAAYAAGCAACGALEGTGALCDYATPLFNRTTFAAAGVPRRAFLAAAGVSRAAPALLLASIAQLRLWWAYARPLVERHLRALRRRSRPLIERSLAAAGIGMADLRRWASRTGPKAWFVVVYLATFPIRLFARTLLRIMAMRRSLPTGRRPRLTPWQLAPAATEKRADARRPVLHYGGAAAPGGAAVRRREGGPGRVAPVWQERLRKAS